MNKYRFFVFAAILLCLLGAQCAWAQTISPYQGNGQLICVGCNIPTLQGVNSIELQQFAPLWARVTDAGNNPVANATVTWNISNGGQYLLQPSNTTTTTDSRGLTQIQFTAPYTQASQGGPVQSTVTATTNGGSVATFTLTQTSVNVQNYDQINLDTTCSSTSPAPPSGCVGYPITGTNVSGTAGTTATPIYTGVFAQGNSLLGGLTGALAGVSVRLINYQSSPTVTCATGSGADAGSVLTDATGYAVCNPIFSGAGTGQFGILVGGVVMNSLNFSSFTPDFTNATPASLPYVSARPTINPNDTQPNFLGYKVSGVINETVTPATLSNIQPSGGNNQTANQGQSLASPLIATLTSTAGNPISGQAVTWTVSPSTAAVLTNTVTISDVNGRVSTNVAFTNSASGRVSITVSAAGKSFTFTVNAVQPTTFSSLTKTGGDNQTTTLNTAFPTALSVQLSVTSGSAANQTIQFSATGPVTVPSTAVTDGNGRAQVTVQAGSTAGNATVTASIGSLTPVTFTLTVAPPGPQLTANSFYNGADFQKGAISPCSIATIIAPGLAPNISGVVASYNLVGFLNYTVAADSVTVAGAQAPIYNVSNQNGTQQVTFQVPCSVAPGANVPVVVTVGGFAAPAVNVTILPASPGVFQTQSNVTVPNFGSLPIAVIMKRDGTLVSPQNPARLNETVIAYVTGMGPTSPSVNTNALPIFGTAAPFTGQVVVGIQNAGVPVTFAQLSEDLIGVGLVAFQIPANSPTGNVVFSIGLVPVGSSTAYYSSPAAIYIQ